MPKHYGHGNNQTKSPESDKKHRENVKRTYKLKRTVKENAEN